MFITECFSNKAKRAFLAKTDAEEISAKNESSFSADQKQYAQAVKSNLSSLYTFKNIYINYRQRFISVKVAHAEVANTKELRKYESRLTRDSVAKVITKTGVIYRIPRV